MKKRNKSRKNEGTSDAADTPHFERSGDLQHFELTGKEDKSPSTETTETDDDEREGVGDGNIGRSKRHR